MDFVASLGPTLAYLVLLMVFGLVGNTLVFMVYYKKFKPSSTRTYILVLSVCDLANNCMAVPFDIFKTRFRYTGTHAARPWRAPWTTPRWHTSGIP